MTIQDEIRIAKIIKENEILTNRLDMVLSNYYMEVTDDYKRKQIELKLKAIK